MLSLKEECYNIISAAEVKFLVEQYKIFVDNTEVKSRTTKSVLRQSLYDFGLHCLKWHRHETISSTKLDEKSLELHFSNTIVDMRQHGEAMLYDFMRSTIDDWGSDRISLSKFLSECDEFATEVERITFENMCISRLCK